MDRRNFIKNIGLAAAKIAVLSTIFGKTALAQGTNKGGKKMKILVITGSARKNGNSNTLADSFIKGAEENGHTVVRFDSAFKQVHHCTGCNSCGMNGPCVFKDDFEDMKENVVDADMIIFVTPMYYFGISAQLKTVIDRFYSINSRIHGGKKTALFLTYADNNKIKEEPIRKQYEVMVNYLGWTDVGQIVAPGVWNVGAINNTKYVQQAYELGKSL